MPYQHPHFPSANEALETYAAARLRIARLRVRGGESLREVVKVVAAESATALSVARVGVWFLVDDGRALSIYHLHAGTDAAFEGALLLEKSFPRYFEALDLGELIAADDVLSDPRTAEFRDVYCEPLGVTSLLDVPVIVDGAVVGVVCHEHVGPARTWTPDEKAFAVSVAEALAVKVAESARADAEQALHGLQTHLVEMRQMGMLGRMAAGVAHDLNNLLTVVQGNAELLTALPISPPEVLTLARQIEATAHRGRDLALELMELGRQRLTKPRVIHVGEHLERFAQSMGRGLGRAWTVSVSRAGQIGRVMVDPAALERVVMNLTMNSRDAMAEGGVIAIEVADVVVGEGGASPGSYVVVKVTDTGHGMDSATRARVFEPFFTTKAEGGGGHGLGLAIVYDLVDQAGGFIHVDSEPGRGTAVRVYLPRMA